MRKGPPTEKGDRQVHHVEGGQHASVRDSDQETPLDSCPLGLLGGLRVPPLSPTASIQAQDRFQALERLIRKGVRLGVTSILLLCSLRVDLDEPRPAPGDQGHGRQGDQGNVGVVNKGYDHSRQEAGEELEAQAEFRANAFLVAHHRARHFSWDPACVVSIKVLNVLSQQARQPLLAHSNAKRLGHLGETAVLYGSRNLQDTPENDKQDGDVRHDLEGVVRVRKRGEGLAEEDNHQGVAEAVHEREEEADSEQHVLLSPRQHEQVPRGAQPRCLFDFL